MGQTRKIPAEAVQLYTRFIHGEISRRDFFNEAQRFAVAGLTGTAIIEALMPVKTIAQFIKGRIKSLPDLQDALQTAMRLEFSTIPPYLCAQWSINADPGGVGNMIQNIVVEEMYHFALAGNMLTAIGGTPSIANATFIPSYPTNVLPGGIPQKLAVDLKPLTPDQVQVFMQIEFPEFLPVALVAGPATIGAFYDTIAEGFTTVKPAINTNAYAVNFGEATPIKSVVMRSRRFRLSRAKAKARAVPPSNHRKVRRRLPITTYSKRSLPKKLWCRTERENGASRARQSSFRHGSISSNRA